MHSTRTPLEQYLDDLAATARPGDRLPPIRELMRRFGVSQQVVQAAFGRLKAAGRMRSDVGRGSFFVGPGRHDAVAPDAARPPVRSVLLLRRSIGIQRGRVLLEKLQARFAALGCRVLEVSYTDPEHARALLKGLPHFDACVLQSSFMSVPIDLLAAIRERCDVLAVDGAALVGTDAASVGIEWGDPLAAALALLQGQGHACIAFASTSHPFLATQLGRRRFETLSHTLAGTLELRACYSPHLPGEEHETAVADWLAGDRAAAVPPCTAVVAWGVEDGQRFQRLLLERGLVVPRDLSVVLLGRTDLDNEHAGFFTVVGCRVADQVEQLLQAVHAHWGDPVRPYGVTFVPLSVLEGSSVAPPPRRPQAGRSARATVTVVSAAHSPR